MNERRTASGSSLRLLLSVFVLSFAWLLTAPVGAFPIPDILTGRFRGPIVRMRSVEGVRERVTDGKLRLRLKDFLTLVLANDTDINIVRLDVMTQADAVLSAHAPFDPALTASFNAQRSISPQFTQIAGASTLSSLNQFSQANYNQVLPTGQTVTVGFTASRSSDNSQFQFFNPSIFTGLNFAVTQPLLRDRTNLSFRAPLQIARAQLLIVSDDTEVQIANLVASAAGQYWDAIEARENIRVAQQSLDLAQKSYERDQMALDLGALPKLDIFQSQSQVAQRKVAVIQAEYAYRNALDGLRRLIGADLIPETRDVEIVLEDDPVVADLDEISVGELLGLGNVDGALVGGASLKAQDFLAIAAAYR